MSELLAIIAAVIGLIAAIVPVTKGIRTRNPAKRRYWESEAKERLGPAKEWPCDPRLRKRAEIALAYLDDDEAIRRTGIPGPAASWIAGAFGYIIAVFCGVVAGRITDVREQLTNQISNAASPSEAESARMELADAASPIPALTVSLVFLAIAVWALLDAADNPKKRHELQRVLVSLTALPGGAEALLERPESLVKRWNQRKYRRQVKQTTKNVEDLGRCYELWAVTLLRTYEKPGAVTSRSPGRSGILQHKQPR